MAFLAFPVVRWNNLDRVKCELLLAAAVYGNNGTSYQTKNKARCNNTVTQSVEKFVDEVIPQTRAC